MTSMRKTIGCWGHLLSFSGKVMEPGNLAQIPRSGLELPLWLLQRGALRRDRQAAPGDSPKKKGF